LEFINGDVAKTVARLPMHGKVAVVIDPPRGGATRGLVSALARRNPATIVYVSCDPPTFARDLAHFKRAGYALRSLDAFDMFPGTFHIESVASLSR
jgi:tRNA/tmRNA/rRNA uracil-C5-methylase (TrmA/RlmC/RlmD family)